MSAVKNLKPGDAIAVCYTNSFRISIYAGLGRVGNPNFWFPDWFSVASLRDQGNKKPAKHYNNRELQTSIVKIDEDSMDDETRIRFEQLRNYLREIKAI